MKKKNDLTAPERLEKAMLSTYPDLDMLTEHMMGMKNEEPWPDWCYLPMAATYAIVARGAEERIAYRYMANTGLNDLRALSAIIPWRLHKVICRFDRDLVDELTRNSGDPMDVPAEVLHHMPWPCVYIDSPPGVEDVIDGVFCFLEYDYRYPDATELRLHYLPKDGEIVMVYLQWSDNRKALFDAMTINNARTAHLVGDLPDVDDNLYSRVFEHLRTHLNMLLYLCSDAPDIDRRAPIPRQRGRGAVQTARYTDKLEVGPYVGSVIRAARSHSRDDSTASVATGTGSTVRPHVRRAHWHLYWTGTGRTIPRVKWVSTMLVNAEHGEIGPVTHPVK